MEEGRPSTTAMIAAMIRAAHLLWDDALQIFQDPLALGLSGVESPGALQATRRTMQDNYAGVLVRQRYAEDELATAVKRGVGQYVILGAGLDSFAYRRPDLATLLRVFEVDHPATQQWKRARLRELSVHLPSNLTFIPLDFERHTLADGLLAGGHRPELPTFFSWLGVTHYLTEEAVFTTLRYVASLAPGSEIVFQYFLPEALFDDENRRLLALWKTRRASVGEPVLSQFEPTTLATRLREFGCTQVWDVGPAELDARYFAGRTDGLRASPQGVGMCVTQRTEGRVGLVDDTGAYPSDVPQ
jgi:methyltransferase (TIGR00027 family)